MTIGWLNMSLFARVFNLFNAGTILSELGNQNAANANLPSSILAPRVLRFGLRVTF